jgi:hypothetical protein
MLPTISYAADAHIGHEDRAAISCWLESIRQGQPEVIVLGGDWLDCEELHKGALGKRQALGAPGHSGYAIGEEIVAMRALLAYIRKVAPQSRILYTLGNHEERIPRIVASQLPQLWSHVPTIAELLGTQALRIDVCRSLEVAGWWLAHGYRYGINPARLTMQDQMGSVVVAHGHKGQIMAQTTASGKRTTYGVMAPCLCQIEAYYMPRATPDWQQGWVTLDPCGQALVPTIHHVRRGWGRWNGRQLEGAKLHAGVWRSVDDARRQWLLEQAAL